MSRTTTGRVRGSVHGTLLLAALLASAPASAAGLGGLALVGPAEDEEEEEPEEMTREQQAREAYQRGRILFQADEFEKAIVAFEEAAALYASPDFQFNLALCHERLKNYDAAMRHYIAYSRSAGDDVDTSDVEVRIKALEQLAKSQREEQDAAAADAAAKDESAGASTPISQPDDEKKSSKAKVLTGAGYGLLGGGLSIAAGFGLGFGLVVAGHNDDLDEIQTGGNPQGRTFAEAQAIADKAKRAQTLEIVGIVAGAGIAVTGAVLVGLGARARKRKGLSLAPVGSPTYAGFEFRGSF